MRALWSGLLIGLMFAFVAAGCGGTSSGEDAGDNRDGYDGYDGYEEPADNDGPLDGGDEVDWNNAAFVAQQVPDNVEAGAVFAVEITMENAGTTTWSMGGSNPYRLGSQSPQDNQTWGTNRIPMEAGSSILPGATCTFRADFTAPAQSGSYDFQWKMVQESVEWFGDFTENVHIEVSATSGSDPEPTEICADNCSFPHIAAATSGRVVMVWAGEYSGDRDVYYRCLDEDTWSQPHKANASRTWSDYAHVVADGQGVFHLTWHENGGHNREIFYAEFPAGAACSVDGWNNEMNVSRSLASYGAAYNSNWCRIDVDEQDAPYVVWAQDLDGDKGSDEIFISKRSGGGFTDPVNVSGTPNRICSIHPALAIHGQTASMVWMDGEAPRLTYFSEWSGANPTNAQNVSGGWGGFPEIDMDSSGRVHVLFARRNGDVYYRRRVNDTWADAIKVSSAAREYSHPYILADDSGHLHGVWTRRSETDGSGKTTREDVMYAVGDAATGQWQEERLVSNVIPGKPYLSFCPVITIDGDGFAHVVWGTRAEPAAEHGGVYYRKVRFEDLMP